MPPVKRLITSKNIRRISLQTASSTSQDAHRETQHRPLFRSVSSGLTRLCHKVLAERIGILIQLNNQQRAFRAWVGGCRENVVLLDANLRNHHDNHKFLYMATPDYSIALSGQIHSPPNSASRLSRHVHETNI